ncbi:MAG: ornithine carbamoyltransferase [Candidatus Omnitrophica bacterium]|nr:ornithine carbamoyltransferase [Candidatus Omnitrophota bacterium]MCF7894195.1 ornithine carbamoyltransferase [Candidatus Omnitrophota bacterium]
MAKKNFISLKNLSKHQLLDIVSIAQEVKAHPQDFSNFFLKKHIGLLFEKPSLRTKTSFYLGAQQLGASAIYYDPQEVRLGQREEICDVSRTLSQYLDVAVLRTFSHQDILEFAKFSSIPIVNGLTDLYHPSQVIADILTVTELKKDIEKIKFSYIGDTNNVCNSLINAFSILGGNLSIATPEQYCFDKETIKEIEEKFAKNGGSFTIGSSPEEAAEAADVLYTDVWSSMGREDEAKQREKVFKNFQINGKILEKAKKDSVVMHCLPAHRGQEVTDSVFEGDNSVVFLQAANRLHAAKAILIFIWEK